MPPNTVSVCRPGKWGNPFSITEYGRTLAIKNYRGWLAGMVAIGARDINELRGKDLACFCRPGEPCHADILLEAANA